MMHHGFDLSGRTALVTGSSRGIGRGLAHGLVEAGCTVVLNGHDAERLEAARAEMAGTHRRSGPRRGLRRHRPGRSRDRSRCHRGAGRDAGHPGQQRRRPAPRRARRLPGPGLVPAPRHERDQRLPGRPGGGPTDGAARRRQDRQHRLVAERGSTPRDRALRRHEGSVEDAHEGDVCGSGAGRDSGQCGRPRLHRD
jgi:hypothetical protein